MPCWVAAALLLLLALILSPRVQAQASSTPVRLASLEWEPYVGIALPEQGFAAAVVRAAYADQGVPVEIEFHPWEQALERAREGEIDGIFPEYYNDLRESEFTFSASWATGALVLYKRRDADVPDRIDPSGTRDAALRALERYRFGVVSGYLNTPAFDAADYLVKIAVEDDAANLRQLANGDVDLAVIDRRVAEHLIRTRHPEYATQLAPLSPPLGQMQLYVAFSRKSPSMTRALEAFNRGLDALRADGRLQALRERHLDQAPSWR